MWSKYISLFLFALLLTAGVATSQVVINEGSNRNYLLLPDEDGEYPDWVELYNAGSAPVDLLNYSITDKLNNPTKWIFPSVILQPGQFLTVYCSDKNRRPEPGFTHVLNTSVFSPILGWNTHILTTPFSGMALLQFLSTPVHTVQPVILPIRYSVRHQRPFFQQYMPFRTEDRITVQQPTERLYFSVPT